MSSVAEVIAAAQQLTPEQLSRLGETELKELALLVDDAYETQVDGRCEDSALWWAQNQTLTEDPHWQERGKPFKAPFPKLSYMPLLFEAFRTHKRLLVCKTREMLSSWAVMVYATHQAQYFKSEVVVQTSKEEKAKRLCEYASILYRNQPEWLKRRHPLKGAITSLGIEWASGGKLFGLTSSEDAVRMYHPTLMIFDEAAFLPGIEVCWDAVEPVAKQIIGISSAGPGFFADQCSAHAVVKGEEKVMRVEDAPKKEEVPAATGVGPVRWQTCKKHGEEYTEIWVDSLQLWHGSCLKCVKERV